jgi:hypothetical protein
MTYKEVTYNDLELIREWRNSQLSMLRTPYILTEEMQREFYKDKICNRNSNCRFFSVIHGVDLVGMVGLENIQFENRLAEISLVTNPDNKNYIEGIARHILDYGFNNLNLKSIFAEVYGCSPYLEIWEGLANATNAWENLTDVSVDVAVIPYRKFYKGRYYRSTIYTFINSIEGAEEK